jgi:hypothetical protein
VSVVTAIVGVFGRCALQDCHFKRLCGQSLTLTLTLEDEPGRVAPLYLCMAFGAGLAYWDGMGWDSMWEGIWDV